MSKKFDRQPTLMGAHLILRALKSSDFEELFAAAADPLIWEQHPQKDRYKRDIFEKFFQDAIDSGGALAVLDRISGDRIIGTTRFYDESANAGSGSGAIIVNNSEIIVGYTFIARAYWARADNTRPQPHNYNREMKELVLNYAFQFIDTVIFEVGEHNLRSQKAVLKLGAHFSHKRVLDGKTHCIFRLDKNNWLNPTRN